jgi:hypothetical protein
MITSNLRFGRYASHAAMNCEALNIHPKASQSQKKSRRIVYQEIDGGSHRPVRIEVAIARGNEVMKDVRKVVSVVASSYP